jgi:hypothetical protein
MQVTEAVIVIGVVDGARNVPRTFAARFVLQLQ